MRNRLQIGGTVATLHEESQIVFQPVWRTGDRVMETIGMVVLEHFAGPLFEIRRRYNAQISRKSEACGMTLTVWRFGNQRGERVTTLTANDQLGFPAFPIFGNHSTDSFVPPAIAARSDEDWGDGFGRKSSGQVSRPSAYPGGDSQEQTPVPALTGRKLCPHRELAHTNSRPRCCRLRQTGRLQLPCDEVCAGPDLE